MTSTRLSLATVIAMLIAATAWAADGSAVFQAIDANHDGFLARDELRAHPRLLASFDAIDANRDGRLSNDELQSWHAAHLRKPGSEGKAFTTLDANADGRIDRSELPDTVAARAWFDAADTNRDGVVTKSEARAAREAHEPARAATVARASPPPAH